MFGAGGEVAVRRGQLILRALSPIPALYRGVPLHPDDDPSVFWIDLPQFGIGPAKVVFCSDAAAGTASLHLDLVPPSLERQPATTNPRYWATGALAALGVAIAVKAVTGRSGLFIGEVWFGWVTQEDLQRSGTPRTVGQPDISPRRTNGPVGQGRPALFRRVVVRMLGSVGGARTGPRPCQGR
jgi:hypothetical protein